MPPADPSLSLAQRIDATCDRFEADWKTGRRPGVEAYLQDVLGTEQEAVRSALLAVQKELETHSRSVESSVSQDSERTGAYASAPRLERIGRFEILALLGEGAFGRVYKARDPQLDREVAIKVPRLEAYGEPVDLQRFLREAKSAAAVQHPNICPVHEVSVEGGQPYIVMAFVHGKSLAEYLKGRSKPLPPKQAALIARKLALALQAAHDKGIVHRDLKPANILFDPQRKEVVITDFGLAVRTTGDVRQTHSGMLMGTPAYMSPEQARGDVKQVGPASDIFALGVILYELLTGQRPFQGSLGDVIGQIQHVEPPSIRTCNPELDERLEAICRQAMAKDGRKRFASMKALAAALYAYLRDQPQATAMSQKAKEVDPEHSAGLAQVMAALSADRRAETEAAVDAAMRRARPPVKLLVILSLLFLGSFATLAGIIFYTRTPTATVMISIDVDLNDKTLSFFLDGNQVSAESLQSPIELKVGTHELIVKRGVEIVRKFTFTVSRDAGPRIELREETPPNKRPPQGDPKMPDDLHRWQGAWRCVAERSRGKPLTEDELKERATIMRIEGSRREVERTLDGRFSRYGGTFQLNSAKSPKEFDYDDDQGRGLRNHHRGVYEFDGERLRLIYRHAQGSVPQRAVWGDLGQPNVEWFEFERVSEDPDGAAAEWIIRIGAKGELYLPATGNVVRIGTHSQLPTEPFRLTKVDFEHATMVTDEAANQFLKGLQYVEHLRVNFDTNPGHRSLAFLKDWRRVKEVWLNLNALKADETLTTLVRECPNIEKLTIVGYRQAGGIGQLKKLRNLNTLWFIYCTLDNEEFDLLTGHESLKVLIFGSCGRLKAKVEEMQKANRKLDVSTDQ